MLPHGVALPRCHPEEPEPGRPGVRALLAGREMIQDCVGFCPVREPVCPPHPRGWTPPGAHTLWVVVPLVLGWWTVL